MICVGSEEGKKLHVLVLALGGENSGFQINLAHTARTQSGWALELLLVLYSAFKHPLSFWLKISCPNEVTFTLADCWRKKSMQSFHTSRRSLAFSFTKHDCSYQGEPD